MNKTINHVSTSSTPSRQTRGTSAILAPLRLVGRPTSQVIRPPVDSSLYQEGMRLELPGKREVVRSFFRSTPMRDYPFCQRRSPCTRDVPTLSQAPAAMNTVDPWSFEPEHCLIRSKVVAVLGAIDMG